MTRRAKKDGTKATIVYRGEEAALDDGPAADRLVGKAVDDLIAETDDAVAQKAKRKGGKDAQRKAIETLQALRELGPGLTWPTKFRPHLVCAKKKAKETLRAEHGVSFRRDGDDCVIEATNGVALVRIRLRHEGEPAPTRAVVPAKAMKLLSAAEDESATLWFHGTKVTIVVDEEIHEFRCIPPDLPFPTPDLADIGGAALSGVHLDAEHLLNIQRALAGVSLAMRAVRRGTIALLPDGMKQTDEVGFLQLWNDTERDEPAPAGGRA